LPRDNILGTTKNPPRVGALSRHSPFSRGDGGRRPPRRCFLSLVRNGERRCSLAGRPPGLDLRHDKLGEALSELADESRCQNHQDPLQDRPGSNIQEVGHIFLPIRDGQVKSHSFSPGKGGGNILPEFVTPTLKLFKNRGGSVSFPANRQARQYR